MKSVVYSRHLTSHSHELCVVQRVYENAFPIDERREFKSLLSLMEMGNDFNIEAIYLNNVVCGFLSWWEMGSWRYIEHFAIDEVCRGKGVGREVLHKFLSGSTTPVVLEVEPPLDDVSRRRVDFYRSFNFVLHDDFKYIQPSYGEGRSPIELKLMSHSAEAILNLEEVSATLHRVVYGVE